MKCHANKPTELGRDPMPKRKKAMLKGLLSRGETQFLFMEGGHQQNGSTKIDDYVVIQHTHPPLEPFYKVDFLIHTYILYVSSIKNCPSSASIKFGETYDLQGQPMVGSP